MQQKYEKKIENSEFLLKKKCNNAYQKFFCSTSFHFTTFVF